MSAWLPWALGAAGSAAVFAAIAAPFLLAARDERRTPIPAGWAPGELAQLRTARPAPAGRHHLVGVRAAESRRERRRDRRRGRYHRGRPVTIRTRQETQHGRLLRHRH